MGTPVPLMKPHVAHHRPSGYQRIKCLARNGVRPALGHDRACTEEDVLGAIRAAASEGGPVCRCHVTHLFNVSGFHHRLPSLGNFGLLNSFPPGMPAYQGLQPPTVEIITDFKHVHPLTVAAVVAARASEDVACITDSVLEPVPGTSNAHASVVSVRSSTVAAAQSLPVAQLPVSTRVIPLSTLCCRCNR